MVSIKTFRQICLSFAHVLEQPHFEKTSFRVNGKIFASLETEKARVTLKFSAEEQQRFSTFDKAIKPVDNHWGKSGWTYLELKEIREELLVEALQASYKEVSKTKKGNAG